MQRVINNECYCKKKDITDKPESSHPSRTSIINNESSLHSSKSRKFLDKDENLNEKMVDRRSMTIDFDIKSPDKQKYKRDDLRSQVLSPDTQNAIENAEKILEEVQYKITEATLINSKSDTKRRIKTKDWYSDDLESLLNDEKEEMLYIRDLVSSKLKEIKEDSKNNSEQNDSCRKIKEKRNNKFSHLFEPKFRTMNKYSNDNSYKKKNHFYVSTEKTKSHHSKNDAFNEIKNNDPIENIKKQKIKSLTIQKGPILNIERNLKKQKIGFVNILPDPSFVQSHSNFNVYEFRHKSFTNDKSINDKSIDRSEINKKIYEIVSNSDPLINEINYVKKDIKENDNNIIITGKNDYQSCFKSNDELKNDLLYENETNNSRREEENRGNVSKHLPTADVDNNFHSNTKLNASSSFLPDHIEQKFIFIDNVPSNVDTNTNKLLIENQMKNTIESLDNDKHVDNYNDINKTTGNIPEIKGDDIKLIKKKKTIEHREKCLNVIKKHDFVRNREQKIDESFDKICQKYNLKNQTNKSYKFKYNSTTSTDNSFEDFNDIKLNDLVLNPLSIDNLDDICLRYDRIIKSISNGEKELENALKKFQLKFSIQSDKNKLSDNIEIKSNDMVALKINDSKLNPMKFLSKHKKDEKTKLSLSDDNAIILKDKLKTNSCIKNRSSLINQFNHSKQEISKSFTYSLEKNKNDRFINKTLTLDKSISTNYFSHRTNYPNDLMKNKNESNQELFNNEEIIIPIKSNLNVENIQDKTKTLEIFSNEDKIIDCVPISTNYFSHRFNYSDDFRKNKDESNRELFNNEEIIPRISKFLLERREQFFNRRSSSNKKIYLKQLMEDLIKYLEIFYNKYDHDIPTILQKFIDDFINLGESDLFLDFLSILKYNNENEDKSSSKVIVENKESQIQIDDITNINCLIERQNKFIEINPLNSIEIINDTKCSIDEINQKKVQLLEKSTPCDILKEQNNSEYENQIIEDVKFDKENVKKISETKSETKSETEEYSLKENEDNYSNSTKLNLIVNDDICENDKTFEKNTLASDELYSPENIINKLSDGEYSNNTSNSNIENIPDGINFVTSSLETSRSEGELYLPSSCSYSIGEVRVMKNSASVCNRVLVNNNTLTCTYDIDSLLHYSSGEVQRTDSTNTF